MEKLFNFLDELVSEERKQLLHRILEMRTKHFVVAAEDIYQEHNASALIRTCDCFGIQEMHVIKKSYDFKIERGMTRGAHKWVDVHVHKHDDGLGYFKDAGYQIVATTPHGADCHPENFDCSKKSVFYFGREKEGLSENIIDAADVKMKIPMTGFTESLNISVSAAIILYELTSRLRESENVKWRLSEKDIYDKKIDWYLKSIPNAQKTLRGYLKNNPGTDMNELKRIIKSKI